MSVAQRMSNCHDRKLFGLLAIVLAAFLSAPASAAPWLSTPTDIVSHSIPISAGNLTPDTEILVSVVTESGDVLRSLVVRSDSFGYLEFDFPIDFSPPDDASEVLTVELRSNEAGHGQAPLARTVLVPAW